MLTHVHARGVALILIALVAAPSIGTAQTDHFWNGSLDENWNKACNWNGCSGPPNNGTAAVHFPASPGSHQTLLNSDWSIRRLAFEGDSHTLLSVLGFGIQLTVGAEGILMSASDTCFLSLDTRLGANQAWTNASSSLLWAGVGSVDLNGHSLTVVTGGALGSGPTYVGNVKGTGNLIKAGAGTLTLGGANTYTGSTRVLGGTLRSGDNNVIPPGTLAVRAATLDLDGYSETIGPGAVSDTGLVLGTYPTDGSAAAKSTFVLSPGHPLGISTLGTFILYDEAGSPGPAVLSGQLDLGTTSGTRTIQVGESPSAETELVISANIVNPLGAPGPNPVITKVGHGRLELSGTNTFARELEINAGTLVVASDGALGATGAGNGTSVAPSASLELRAGSQVGDEPLVIQGTGVDGGGALRCVNSSSSWSGTVSLADDSRISVEDGRLALTGVTGSAVFLDVSGDGAGTLALTGTNTGSGVFYAILPGGRLSVENLSGSATGNANISIASTGVLTGASPLKSNIIVQGGGRIEPGAPIGVLGAGSANLAVGSLLKLELAGALPGQYDRFEVVNNLTVSGDLEVSLANGFVPAIGDTFTLVMAGTPFSAFHHGTAPALPPDRTWQLAYVGNSLVARVIAAASVDVEPSPPSRNALLAAAPNPFSNETAIAFELAQPGRVDIELFDAHGRRVAVLVEGASLPAGRHTARWSGVDQGARRAGPGVYWVRMRVDGAPVRPSRRLVRSS